MMPSYNIDAGVFALIGGERENAWEKRNWLSFRAVVSCCVSWWIDENDDLIDSHHGYAVLC
jgi:hypothetical protein